MVVDYKEAESRLNLAYKIASSGMTPVCNYADFLDFVIDSKQKTYKYVLFTAILSKSVNSQINPLCLQLSANCEGAYTARSVCDRVVIPFERKTLNNALGGSPSPYTSKPASMPMLDCSYPAHGKEARTVLKDLCETLPKIKSSAEAFECLIYLVFRLNKKNKNKRKVNDFNFMTSEDSLFRLINFINVASQKSFYGETLTLLTAGIYYLQYKNSAKVVVHPVNQCGTSSRQISDLDVFEKNTCILCNELKDKKYSEHDVRYAVDKAIDSGLNKMYFIEGYYGMARTDFKKQLEQEYMNKGFLLKITSLSDLAFNTLNVIEDININSFLHFIIQEARNNCFSDEVVEWLLDCADIHFDDKKEVIMLRNNYIQTQSPQMVH